MAYVIKNVDTGKYVSKAGSKSSYTNNLGSARKYSTKKAAENECCENERAIDLEVLLDELRN